MDLRNRLHLALKDLSLLLGCEVFDSTFVGVVAEEPGRKPGKPRWVRAACVGDPRIDGSVHVLAVAKSGESLIAAVLALVSGIRQERARSSQVPGSSSHAGAPTASVGGLPSQSAPVVRPVPPVVGPVTARPRPSSRPPAPPPPVSGRLDAPPVD